MSAPSTASDPMQQVMQVASGYIASSALYVVAELGLADHLVDGPKRCPVGGGDGSERECGASGAALARELRNLRTGG